MANNPDDRSFLGRGWSFPPRFVAGTDSRPGRVEMSADEEDIRASLRILLGTTAGERLRHPEYGLNLQSLLFESLNTTEQTLLVDRIRTALLVYEPRIEVHTVDLDSSEINAGRLLITIDYEIRATNSRFNLVYPFYLRDGNEVAGDLVRNID
jgi:phage baseplate assembly protein W